MPEQSKEQARERIRNDYLTAQQLAEILQTSKGSIDRLRRAGRIPYIRVSERVIRYNLREVRQSLTVAPQHGDAAPHDEPDSSNQLSFEDLFAGEPPSDRV